MKFAIKADITEKQTIDCLILPISSKKNHTDFFKKIDSLVDNQLSKFLTAGGLVFAKGKTSWFIPNKSAIKRILLVSLIDDNKKKATELSVVDFRKIIKNIAVELKHCSDKKSVFPLVDFNLNQSLDWQIMQVIRIMNDIWYCFDKFKQNTAPKLALQQIDLVITKNSDKQFKTYINYAESIVAGMSLTKDLGNTPGNVCNPTYLAAQAQSLAKQHKKLKCSILDEKKLRALKMNTLLSVGEGSAQPSKLICLQFMNANNKKAPVIALVGKGVTFDTGGISIKPSAKMDEMKYDMCGAASVLGTMKAIALLDLPINVVAVIGAAENMPGSKATRPGDIVKSMSGKTIEILNTDAEGRLVLCDALTYVQKTFKPTTIIDIATLTGACVVALGKHNSGLFSNDQQLADDLLNASKETDDLAWQLPLGAEYAQLLQSSCADIANIGGPYGGSITAACFLEKFIENCKWAHLDIAGTAWISGNKKHATGRPVPLLVKYLINSI